VLTVLLAALSLGLSNFAAAIGIGVTGVDVASPPPKPPSSGPAGC
jgi:F0F1-type ATP synthase membrane subunit c/vacuolar-type H+-ATPase subunit K